MIRLCKILFTAAIGTAALVSAMDAYSQDKRNLLVPVKTARPAGPRPVVRRAPAAKPIVVEKKVKVSYLSVTTELGATVVLKSAPSARKLYTKTISATDGVALFGDLASGDYLLGASKDGFEFAKDEKIKILPQQGLARFLAPKAYKVKIATGIKGGGEIQFAPAIFRGFDPQGNILSEQLGQYCVAKIQENGDAEISNLQKKYYDIDIRPDDAEYNKTLRGIDLTKMTDDDDDDSEVLAYNLTVEKKVSVEEFSTNWIASDWNMPSTWRLEDRRMKVKNLDGIAIPRDSRFLSYTNFEMVANVKLKDNATVGFVLRYEDPQNYYLLQISGERGETPNNAVGYVVENGQRRALPPALTDGFAKTLSSDDGFEVRIKSEEKGGFAAWIEDVNTAKVYPLGRFPDDRKTFKKGAVGIAGSPKSNFEVKSFRVCTPACPK
ncbi:MAG: carboxypeptidase-like regulatory domain-containing protein [Pyrinomonadaceae bacterium]